MKNKGVLKNYGKKQDSIFNIENWEQNDIFKDNKLQV